MTEVWRENNDPRYYPGGHSVSEIGKLHLVYNFNFDHFGNEVLISVTEYVDGDAVEWKHFSTSDEAFEWMRSQLEVERKKNGVGTKGVSKACEECGRTFSTATTGRPPRFCGTRCRIRAHRKKKKGV